MSAGAIAPALAGDFSISSSKIGFNSTYESFENTKPSLLTRYGTRFFKSGFFVTFFAY